MKHTDDDFIIYTEEPEAVSALRVQMIEFTEKLSAVLSLDDAIRITSAIYNVPPFVLAAMMPETLIN